MEDNRENRPDEEVPRDDMRCRVLRAVLSETCEDHLGVTLIQSGGSRYEQMKWQLACVCKHL